VGGPFIFSAGDEVLFCVLLGFNSIPNSYYFPAQAIGKRFSSKMARKACHSVLAVVSHLFIYWNHLFSLFLFCVARRRILYLALCSSHEDSAGRIWRDYVIGCFWFDCVNHLVDKEFQGDLSEQGRGK
jgi:hypothetical protein